MARPIPATPTVRGKDAEAILHEMRRGTPDPDGKRRQTIERATKVYAESMGNVFIERTADPLEAIDVEDYAEAVDSLGIRLAHQGKYEDANLLIAAARVLRALMERCE